jgi:hypothetical protein
MLEHGECILGITQNLDTQDYVIVFVWVKDGSLRNFMNKNSKDPSWSAVMRTSKWWRKVTY